MSKRTNARKHYYAVGAALTVCGAVAAAAFLYSSELSAAEQQPTGPQQIQVGPAGGGVGHPGSVEQLATEGLEPERYTTADGKSGWVVTIPGGRALATPAVVDGMVFVGGGFGSYEFYAFDAASGKPIWKIRVSDDGPTAAVVDKGCVVFNTESCTLFCVDAKTGDMRWSKWLGDPLMSQPAVGQDCVVMAYPTPESHMLICLGLESGEEHWKTAVAGDIISAPVLDGDSVYLTTFDGTVYRHRLKDGKEIWSGEKHATSAPWISAGRIYVSLREDKQEGAQETDKPVEALGTLSNETGDIEQAELWSKREALYLSESVQRTAKYAAEQMADDAAVGFGGGAPAAAKIAAAAANVGQFTVRGLWEFQGSRVSVVGGRMYNAMGDILQSVNPKTGKVLWRNEFADTEGLGGSMFTPPSVVGRRIYVGTAAGELQCYNTRDGRLLWKANIGEPIRFQPAVARGSVYIGTTSGRLICIDTGDKAADGWLMWGGSPGHNGPVR